MHGQNVIARFVVRGAAALLLLLSLFAQDDYDSYGPQPTGASKAMARYKADMGTYTNAPHMLVMPGLRANSKERRIEVLAEYTGLRGGETVEFLLVDQASSHGYEALLWSYAKPSDVHRALEFIGLKPGPPFDPSALRLWSDGDRVNVSVQDAQGDSVRIEELVLDRHTETSLPLEGFVFAGSVLLPSREGDGQPQYAADVYDPRSVASLYSEPAAVLDVPRHVSKGDAYGNQVVNPERGFAPGEMLTIVMEPADLDGLLRARHLVIAASPWPGVAKRAPATTHEPRLLESILITLKDEKGDRLNPGDSYTAALESLVALRKEGRSPVLDVSVHDALLVSQVKEVSALLALIENMLSIRITPPKEGQLYYGAFLPQETWRSPEHRPSQPWELHLSQDGGNLSAKLVLHRETTTSDQTAPTFERIELDATDPEHLAAHLRADAKQGPGDSPAAPAALLVYAEADLTYGQLMRFVTPALKTHAAVYVFTDDTKQKNPAHRGTHEQETP